MNRLLWLWIALAVLIAGCSKLTAANYEKLKVGMAYQDVKALLGEPTACSDVLAAKHCVWGDDKSNVTVNFVADKVVLFAAHNIH